jgi:UDP-3-O-[3-hydroxymyristoyl] glucosamine N-acyltransferase
MEFTAKQIANFLNGKIDGNGDAKVTNVSKIEDGKAGTLAFLANPKYCHYLYDTKASIVLVNSDFKTDKTFKCTLIYVEDAYRAFATLLELVAESMFENKNGIEEPSFIHQSVTFGNNLYLGAFAYVSKNVKLGNNVKVYPQVYIGENTVIGDNTIIYAGAKIYYGCSIGNQVIIHSGAVIGADGFGFAPSFTANYKKIPQIGNVILEDYVEIGSNTTVDRATMGSTIIRKGVKLDNLIQIGHNVEVGENTVMAAQVGISGSTKVGKNCMLGGQVGVSGHITIADDVKIAAQSGIAGNVKQKGKTLMGYPAYDSTEFKKSYVIQRRLPEIYAKLNVLEKEFAELKSKAGHL